MHGELFDSTIPFGEPELMKASAYRRYLDELGESTSADAISGPGSRLTQLGSSMTADLQRLEQRDGINDPIEVMAACIRHQTRVTIHLECGERVVPMTVFPAERLVYCPGELRLLIDGHLPELKVMHLEPAALRPPGDPQKDRIGEPHLHRALAPLLWELALRGPRRDLLPEIAGPAVYRVSPALDAANLPQHGGVMPAAILRLRRQATSLGGIAAWPGFDRERAARLVNGLYLQAGLIVSRSHPSAVRDSWFG